MVKTDNQEIFFKFFCIFCMTFLLVGGKSMDESKGTHSIFDFKTKDSAEQWFVINDVVMGGVSNSSFDVTGSDTAVFSGRVSLENNGGFASVSTKPAAHNLDGFDGLRIRVKGDGKTYKISVKNDDAFTGSSYQFQFGTERDKWITIDTPFSAFIAQFRGRVLSNAAPIDQSSIKSFGLLISDKQAGPFRLEIDWISAYRKS
jgi:monofunctional biosynthetic peptidoglycan transglycosylase